MLSIGQRASFAASVTNTSDTTVTWSVGGVPNGNLTVGQVCESGTNPCGASRARFRRCGLSRANFDTSDESSRAYCDQPCRSIEKRCGDNHRHWPYRSRERRCLAGVLFRAVVNRHGEHATVCRNGCGKQQCGRHVDCTECRRRHRAARERRAEPLAQADSTRRPTRSVAERNFRSRDEPGGSHEIRFCGHRTHQWTSDRGNFPFECDGGAVESFPLVVQGVNFVAGSGQARP